MTARKKKVAKKKPVKKAKRATGKRKPRVHFDTCIDENCERKACVERRNLPPLKFPHYWLCDTCAHEKGGVWPAQHVATGTTGDCKYCGLKNTSLMPWVDYNWPKEDKRTNFIAAVNRD